jgi:hypothetical protein
MQAARVDWKKAGLASAIQRGDGWGMPNPKKSGRNKPLQSRSHSKTDDSRKSPRHGAAKPPAAKPSKRSGTFQKSTGEPSQKLRASILRQISQRPLDAAGIASALDLPPAWKGKLLQLLKEMETAGDIARIEAARGNQQTAAALQRLAERLGSRNPYQHFATAQAALAYGADDIDGTVRHELIYHDAGATTPEVLSVDAIKRLIREAGREPVERDTLYHRVERTGDAWRSAEPLRTA